MVGVYLIVLRWLVSCGIGLIRRAQQVAEEIRADTIRTLAHALDNALFAISGYADILAAEGLRCGSRLAQGIKFLALGAAQLLMNMIDATRPETRPFVARPETLAPSEVLEKVHQWFAGRAQDLGVTITLVQTQAPNNCVADGQVLERALHNLVSNALRHVKSAGHIEIGCREEAGSIVW